MEPGPRRPGRPGFLIEVIALALITGTSTGSHAWSCGSSSPSAADRLADGWPDPAGIGPDVSDVLDSDQADGAARAAAAGSRGDLPLGPSLLDHQAGPSRPSPRARSLFGHLFPLSYHRAPLGPARLHRPGRRTPGPTRAPAAALAYRPASTGRAALAPGSGVRHVPAPRPVAPIVSLLVPVHRRHPRRGCRRVAGGGPDGLVLARRAPRRCSPSASELY